ncbi:hypothetical protein [Streptomyces sp. NPDC046985]|uniref:hypothetical protein n=1 Tax=Streptomyces sp. NPDC046985 TaxID=3155377 RepID=UPI003404341E
MSWWRPWHGNGAVAGPPAASRTPAASHTPAPSRTPAASHTPAPSRTPAATAYCPPADLAGLDGGSAAFWRKRVEPVHRAACAGDFAGLARLLGGGHVKDFATEECNGCTSSQIVTMWREEYGWDSAALARLLETAPSADQGGLTYTRGDLAAIFDRGTHELPAMWSGFYVQCHEHPECVMLRTTG